MSVEPVQSLSSYGENFLQCRDLGHAWREDEQTVKRSGGIGTVVRVLGCLRCNTTRLDSFNYRGELLTRTYRQPEGYKLAFRPLTSEVREQRFKQLRAALKSVQQDKSMDLSPNETVKAPDSRTTPQPASRRRERQLASVG